MTTSTSLDFSNLTGRIEDGSRPFALQYMSLMLTILCFVVGAFAGNKMQQTQRTQPARVEIKRLLPVQATVTLEPTLSTMVYDDLFTGNSKYGDLSDSASALAILLKNHDLKIVGEIAANDKWTSENAGRIEFALRRAHVLETYLLSQGVPAHAIELFASDSATAPQALLQFNKITKHSSLLSDEGADGK